MLTASSFSTHIWGRMPHPSPDTVASGIDSSNSLAQKSITTRPLRLDSRRAVRSFWELIWRTDMLGWDDVCFVIVIGGGLQQAGRSGPNGDDYARILMMNRLILAVHVPNLGEGVQAAICLVSFNLASDHSHVTPRPRAERLSKGPRSRRATS